MIIRRTMVAAVAGLLVVSCGGRTERSVDSTATVQTTTSGTTATETGSGAPINTTGGDTRPRVATTSTTATTSTATTTH